MNWMMRTGGLLTFFMNMLVISTQYVINVFEAEAQKLEVD
jgi:hypothetical protein